MSRYTSKHTGPKIDEAVDRANGYGLGGTAKILTDADDLNNIKTTGWYCYHSNKHPANVPTPEVYTAVMEVIFGYYSGQTMQRVYSTGDNNDWNLVAQRVSYGSGVWQPWEWVDPPMKSGVEYRTTERWSGRPVYKKNVDFGTLPTGTTKAVSIGAENIRDVAIDLSLSYCRSDYGQNVLPITSYITGVEVVSGSIKLTTNSAAPSKTCLICVKYTKTTD